MRRFFCLILVLIVAPVSAFADPAIGVGDLDFYVDSASFLNADGTTRTEIYIRIPNSQIKFEPDGDRYEGSAAVAVRIKDDDGGEVVREEVNLTMLADDEDQSASPLFFQTLIKVYQLAPGEYEMAVSVRDNKAPKHTVVGMMRKQFRRALVDRLALSVPDFDDGMLTASDSKFLSSIEQTDNGPFYHPNPSRVYGLYRDSLQVLVEVYVPGNETAPLKMETVVMDDNGEMVKQSSIVVENVGDIVRQTASGQNVKVFSVVIREDLNHFPAGRYSLYLDAGLDQDPLLRLRAGSFSVAWDMQTWESTRRNFLAEARFLLDEGEFDGFAEMSPGEQEEVLAAMWKDLDPDPSTGVNEAHEEFEERLAYATAHYADYRLGFQTDRGLTYMRFGAPDELIVDVMPRNRESIQDALAIVEDRFHVVTFSGTGARAGKVAPQRNIIVDPRRAGAADEGGAQAFPFELWIYTAGGKPIRERDRNIEQDIGLRFIFVDRNGYGQYRLESSSAMTAK